MPHWPALTVFLQDGRVPINNNWIHDKRYIAGAGEFVCGANALRRELLV